LRKILALVEGFASNPAASTPLRNLEAWLDKLPQPVRAVIMDLLANLAETARTVDFEEDEENVIVMRDVDNVHWKQSSDAGDGYSETVAPMSVFVSPAPIV
jgi:hypothetical protein